MLLIILSLSSLDKISDIIKSEDIVFDSLYFILKIVSDIIILFLISHK